MKAVLTALGALLLVYAVLCAYVYVAQDRLVFFPAPNLDQTPADSGLAYEDVHMNTADGETIHGWYIPTETAGKHVLFFHGNAGNISDRPQTVRILNGMGHAVLIVDYRGYGQSSGQPSEAGTYQDAAAAWDYLTATRRVDPQDIVIYGRSLGGAVAVWLAAERDPGGLIVESTFSRMADMGAYHYPYLPVRLLTRIRYDSVAHIAHVRCPVFSAHSRDDELVPFDLGKALADAAPTLAHFVVLNGGHNAAFFQGGTDYYGQLDAFIRNPSHN